MLLIVEAERDGLIDFETFDQLHDAVVTLSSS